ncbi:MAG: hypothetical protein H0X51_08150 [Parachlamydiaceae bacterium]|nr:hypothetical protein [Parachlamydiaceae bacterium]
MPNFIADVSNADVVLFGTAILFVFVLLVAVFFLGAKARSNAVGMSPYSGLPLRRGGDLPYESAKKILQYLYDKHEYDNRIFDIKRAGVCRETGRVFPNCINWLDMLHVDWTFLRKRHPGDYVSWGSLSAEQQDNLRKRHHPLYLFQTEISSPSSAPSSIELDYIYTKPGPLYVDIETKTLLGWQRVPDSDFEVLIVQKPKGKF